MNRRRYLGIAAAIAAVVLPSVLTVGGYGMLSAPHHQASFSVTVAPAPAQALTVPTLTPSPSSRPCWTDIAPHKVHYDTDAAVTANGFFGRTLAPKSLPAIPADGYIPPKGIISTVVCNEWNALQERPNQALATTAVALPNLDRRYYRASWVTQLGLLADHGDWENANLIFVPAQSPPPRDYTMGMDYRYRAAGANASPRVFVTRAHLTGWYLTVPFGRYILYLRIDCGGQPAFDLHRYQVLLQHYPFIG